MNAFHILQSSSQRTLSFPLENLVSSTLFANTLHLFATTGAKFGFQQIPAPLTSRDWDIITNADKDVKQTKARERIALQVAQKVATKEQRLFLQQYHHNNLTLQRQLDSFSPTTTSSIQTRSNLLSQQTELQQQLNKHCTDICLRTRFIIHGCTTMQELQAKGSVAKKQISIGTLESKFKQFFQ